MFGFRRAISNRVIHNPGRNFLLREKYNLLSPADRNHSRQDLENFEFFSSLLHSLHKESVVLEIYVDKLSVGNIRDQKYFKEALLQNRDQIYRYYPKLRRDFVSNNSLSINSIAGIALLLSEHEDLTPESFDESLKPIAEQKLGYASIFNLIDLLVALTRIRYDPADGFYQRVRSEIENRLQVKKN